MKKSKLIFLSIIIFTVLACFESANEGDGENMRLVMGVNGSQNFSN